MPEEYGSFVDILTEIFNILSETLEILTDYLRFLPKISKFWPKYLSKSFRLRRYLRDSYQ